MHSVAASAPAGSCVDLILRDQCKSLTKVLKFGMRCISSCTP